MDAIINVFQFIQGLGLSVVMPIVIFIIGCAFRTGVGKSLRAGLTVGVGFIGLNLVINSLLGTSLSPADYYPTRVSCEYRNALYKYDSDS